MEINESELEGSFESNGETVHWFNEELALAILLANDVLFSNGRQYVDHPIKAVEDNRVIWDKDKPQINEETVVLFVNCNDVFYWATGDAEALPHDQIETLYKMWKANPKYGTDKWCCLQRKLRPQVPLVEMMKKDGFWDAELEALPAPERS